MSFNRINDTNFAGYPTVDLSCPICLEGFEDDNSILTHDGEGVPHTFCDPCIRFWLGNNSTCPACRINITHINGQALDDLREELGLQRTDELAARAHLVDALYLASRNGNLPQVQLLLAQEFSVEERGRAVWMAINDENDNDPIDIINALLADGEISRYNRGYAVTQATKYGYLDVVNALLANGEISIEHRGMAVILAAIDDHNDIVNALLANNGAISQEDRGIATKWEAQNGHLDVVNALLANGEISSEHRGWAVREAAKNGHLDVVNALLANGLISQTDRGGAVIEAAKKGHLNIITALLANGTISQDDRGWAYRYACMHSHWDIINLFK